MLGRLVTLESFENAMQAHLVKNHLESAGIRAVLADEFAATMYWHLSGAMGGIKLQVAESELERAEQILEALEQAHRSQEPEAQLAHGKDAAAAGEESATEHHGTVEPKPFTDADEADEPPLNAREQMIERAHRAVLIGLFLLPLQFYATWLLLSAWQEDHPIRPELQRKLRWTIALHVPFAIVAFVLVGAWFSAWGTSWQRF
jgi:hypothetical protein